VRNKLRLYNIIVVNIICQINQLNLEGILTTNITGAEG
jgi:hypothetical protein